MHGGKNILQRSFDSPRILAFSDPQKDYPVWLVGRCRILGPDPLLWVTRLAIGIVVLETQGILETWYNVTSMSESIHNLFIFIYNIYIIFLLCQNWTFQQTYQKRSWDPSNVSCTLLHASLCRKIVSIRRTILLKNDPASQIDFRAYCVCRTPLSPQISGPHIRWTCSSTLSSRHTRSILGMDGYIQQFG